MRSVISSVEGDPVEEFLLPMQVNIFAILREFRHLGAWRR